MQLSLLIFQLIGMHVENCQLKKRFIKHGIDKIKYIVFSCEISVLENQLQIKINFFFDDLFNYRRYAMYVFKSHYI